MLTVEHVHTVYQALAERWAVVLPIVAVCLAAWLGRVLLRPGPLDHLPLVAEELGGVKERRQAFIDSATKVYQDGYQKFKDQLFRITSPWKMTRVVIPPKFLNELRKLPDDTLSFMDAIEESSHASYTKMQAEGSQTHILPRIIKTHLTPSLVRLNSAISEEVKEATYLEMPPCDDWTPINIYDRMCRIVAMVSGRIFIGPELCHEEEYINAAINFTLEIIAAQQALDKIPAWQRPFRGHWIPEVKELNRRRERAHRFLQPVVEARKKMEQKPDDMLTWVMEVQEKLPDGDNSTFNLARIQLGLSFAAIHTTTMTTTNAFFNLAVMPDVVNELRDEIRSVLAEHNGEFTSTALQEMKELDSVLKETLRYHGIGATTFGRKVLKPFTLSNGEHIPANVIIEAPADAIAHDNTLFEDADTFDPFRFYKLRQRRKDDGTTEGAAQNQFVSVTSNSLSFGYGRHACPGRFFAANEIKMIMANFLLRYDFKNADGSTVRYKNINSGATCFPDTKKELSFKKVAA